MTVQEPIAVTVEQKVWQFRVQDFLVLAEHGAFAESARAELLDGEIWVLNATHSRHARLQAELQGLLWNALRTSSELTTYVAPSISISDGSLPEPDLAIALPHDEGFLPLDKVKLVVEISDSTLELDLGRKLRVYAAAGVTEYWVIDVNARVVHQFWVAVADSYGERRAIAFGGLIASASIPSLTIGTSSL